jgi:hypothetical protein
LSRLRWRGGCGSSELRTGNLSLELQAIFHALALDRTQFFQREVSELRVLRTEHDWPGAKVRTKYEYMRIVNLMIIDPCKTEYIDLVAQLFPALALHALLNCLTGIDCAPG